VEVFKTELQLVVIQPFGAPTKLAALQLLNDEPEAFDLRLRLSEVGAFGRERPDHPLQRLHIVWQIASRSLALARSIRRCIRNQRRSCLTLVGLPCASARIVIPSLRDAIQDGEYPIKSL
jgi:hypothetical protein